MTEITSGVVGAVVDAGNPHDLGNHVDIGTLHVAGHDTGTVACQDGIADTVAGQGDDDGRDLVECLTKHKTSVDEVVVSNETRTQSHTPTSNTDKPRGTE